MIALIAAAVASIVGYTQSSAFVRDRLRFVDAAQSPMAPVVAGVGAIALGSVAVALLPFVGAGTALAFGASVAIGVANGQRDVRKALPPGM